MNEIIKGRPTVTKNKRTSEEARKITNFGQGIKGLKTALKWLQLNDKEKAILKGILESNQKKYQVYLCDTKPPSRPPSSVKQKDNKLRKSSVHQDNRRKDALDEYKAKLGLATSHSFDTVTNPRPLPGGGKKRHSNF